MQFNFPMEDFSWQDLRFSNIRFLREKALEKTLQSFFPGSVFDDSCTADNAMKLYNQSWFRDESPVSGIFSTEEIRKMVLERFPVEMTLLTNEEMLFYMQLVASSGTLPLSQIHVLRPVFGLLRRLWCEIEPHEDDWYISIPHQLASMGAVIIASEQYNKIRRIISEAEQKIWKALHINGMTLEKDVFCFLLEKLKGTIAENKASEIRRMLWCEYDYICDSATGEHILLHPANILPDMKKKSGYYSMQTFHIDSRSTDKDMADALIAEEEDLRDQLEDMISGITRQECNVEDTVLDMIFLKKLGAPEEELQKVIASGIIIYPAEDIREMIHRAYLKIPCWSFSRQKWSN